MKCHLHFKIALFLNVFCLWSSVSGEALFFEKSILLEIKSSVSDPDEVLFGWRSNSFDHHCSWVGVS
ncbi:hypothetical protein TB1_041194 [Malus domestica]